MDKLTDELLVKKAKQKNIEGFDELIKRYEKKIYNLAYKMLGSEDDAKDVLQEVFILAFKNINKFEEKSTFSTWIYRIAINACIKKIKEKKTTPLVTDNSEPIETIENAIDKKEIKKIIEKEIESLPDIYKVVFILKEIEGLSTKEIAEKLGISLAATKARLHRARLKLRKKIESYI